MPKDLDRVSEAYAGPLFGETFRRQLVRLHEVGAVTELMAWMRERDPDAELDRPVASKPLERRGGVR